MPFSAGTVFLDVVPSFHNLQRRVERETRTVGPALAKNVEAGLDQAAKTAGKKGAEAGDDFVGAFDKKVRENLAKAAKGMRVRVDTDSTPAERSMAALARRLEKYSKLEIRTDVDAANALAQARRLERDLSRIVHDQEVDIDFRFNAAEARSQLEGIRTAVQRALGPTRDQLAEAYALDKQFNQRRVAEAKARAAAEKAATDVEMNMRREAAQFRAIQAQEEKEAAAERLRLIEQAQHENRVFDAERKVTRDAATQAARDAIATENNMARLAREFRLAQRQEEAADRKRIEEQYQRDILALERAAAREQADLRAAIARQDESSRRAAGTGRQGDIALGRSAIEERYEAESRAARAAAEVRIRAAARGLAGEAAASAMAQQRAEEQYKEISRAAAASAAARIAMARMAAAAEVRAGQEGLGQVLARNTGQAANSFRLFNGYLLTAVTIGPLLVPVLMSIAGGLGAIAVMSVGAVAGIAALIAGFGGVGTAVQALAGVAKETRKQSTGSGAQNAARDMRGLRDAQLGLARAREDSGRAIAAAAARQENAERSLTRAVRDAAEAQMDLVDARRAAQRDLEDMNARLAAGQLEEQLAAFALQEAGFRYNNVLEDDQASDRERQIATLEYQQAQQQFADLQRQNRRLAEDTAAANAAGVEGSEQVVAAQERVVSTTEAVSDAQRNVAEASIEVTRARVEQARTLADAEQRVADAMVDLQTQTVAAGVAGSAAMDALNESMRNLSPAGQEFARFLFSLEPYLRALRFAAQDGLLPGVQAGIETLLRTYGPGFITFIGTIATLLGDMAEQAAIALTQPFWQEFFSMMARYAPIFLTQFGQISESLLEMIAGVLMAFAPFSVEIGEAFVRIAEAMADWGKNLAGSEAFAEFLDYVRENGPKVFDLFMGILTIILKVMVGLEPYIGVLLDITLAFVQFLAGLDPQQLAAITLTILAVVGAIQVLSGVMAIISSVIGLVVGLAGVFGLLTGGALASIGAAIAGAIGPFLLIAAAIAGVIAIGWALITFFGDLYRTNEDFRDSINGIWQGIVVAFQWAWGVISGIFGAFGTFINNFLAPWFLFLYHNIIEPVWQGIVGVIEIAWGVISRVFDMIFQVVRHILVPLFTSFYEETIRPIWEDKIQPVFDALGRFLEEHVAPAFQRGLDAISRIWEGLRSIAAAPVRFVVDTVINDGLIDNFNRLVDMFPGMKKITRLEVPAAFREAGTGSGSGGRMLAMATGGVLPGYTPGRDVHRFVSPTGGVLDLSGGEAILRPELTRLLGRDWVDAANRAARTGNAARFLGGYADGGILGWLGAAGEKATDAISGAVGTAASFIANPGAALRGVVQSLVGTGNTGFMGLVAQVPFAIADAMIGAITGATAGAEGPAIPNSGGGIGYRAMSALVQGAFPGSRITSSFRPGAITAVGTRSYHSLGRAIDIAPNMALFNWISANYPGSRELFYSPAGAAQILNGRRNPRLAPVTVADHYDHIHWAMQRGGIVPNLYDNGGMLPPGLSIVANKTGKPEPILTDQQWTALTAGAASRPTVGVQVMGDVVAAEDIVDSLAERYLTRQRDAEFLRSLQTAEVGL